MWITFRNLKIIRCVLHRIIEKHDESKQQLVLPALYTEQFLKDIHSKLTHPGRYRTLLLLLDIDCMIADAEFWVKNWADVPNTKVPLVSIGTKIFVGCERNDPIAESISM